MKYIYRVRQLTKIVYDETNNPIDKDARDSRPPIGYCISLFKKSNPKYDNDDLAYSTLAMATGDGYLSIVSSKDPKDRLQRLVVKSDGIKLINHWSYYINELAGSVGKISPIIAIFVSIAALAMSIYALTHKL